MAAPLKSGQSLNRQWRVVNQQAGAGQFTRHEGINVQHTLAGMRHPGIAKTPMFPFRLYRIPMWYRTSPDPATDWLKFCVRAGKVFINFAEFDATLTDGADACPDGPYLPLESGAGVNEVAVASGTAKYWFWLAIDSTGAEVDHGATPPAWGTGYVPIGWVDTTNTTDKIAIVRQIVRTDLFTCIPA